MLEGIPEAALQYPLLAIVLGVVFWMLNRSDNRDAAWHERQEKRDAAFLASINCLTKAITDLDSTLEQRKQRRDPPDG